MAVPIKKARLKIRRGRPTWIVIHHTICQPISIDALLDKKKFQTGKIRTYNVIAKKRVDINFHFVVEKVDDDFEVIIARPIVAECEFDDIPNDYYRSIHIGLLGDYDVQNATTRLYDVLAYRILVPLMKMFAIPIDRIVFHRDISTNKDCTCPGISVFLPLVKAKVKEYWMK